MKMMILLEIVMIMLVMDEDDDFVSDSDEYVGDG